MMNNNTVKKENANIVTFSEKVLEKRQSEDDYELISAVLMSFTERAEEKALDNVNAIVKRRMVELEEECMRQKIKLQNCIPIGMLYRVFLYAVALVICLCIFVTQIVGNYKILDYHLLLVLSIAFAGLLHTAISALRDWKNFLNNR